MSLLLAASSAWAKGAREGNRFSGIIPDWSDKVAGGNLLYGPDPSGVVHKMCLMQPCSITPGVHTQLSKAASPPTLRALFAKAFQDKVNSTLV